MSDPSGTVPQAGWPTAPPGSNLPQVGFPEFPRPASAGHRIGHSTMIGLLGAGLAVLALVLVLAVVLSEPPAAPSCPPLRCQGPPIGNPFDASIGSPVVNGTLYSNKQGFTVRYYPVPGAPSVPVVSEGASGISLSYPFQSDAGGTAELTVIGSPATNTTAQGIVQRVVNQIAPGAQPAYQLPGALVGYQLGAGEAYNVQPVSSAGSTQTDRLIVLGAIRNGFGIAVVAEGQLLPDVGPGSFYWNGHPSPANLNVAYLGDETVNSIKFPS